MPRVRRPSTLLLQHLQPSSMTTTMTTTLIIVLMFRALAVARGRLFNYKSDVKIFKSYTASVQNQNSAVGLRHSTCSFCSAKVHEVDVALYRKYLCKPHRNRRSVVTTKQHVGRPFFAVHHDWFSKVYFSFSVRDFCTIGLLNYSKIFRIGMCS